MKRAGRSAADGGGRLYALAFLVFLLAYLPVWLSRLAQAPVIRWAEAWPPLFMLVATAAAWAAGRYLGARGDPALPAGALLLAGLGLAIQLRLGVLSPRAGHSLYPLAFPAGVAIMLALGAALSGGRVAALSRAAIPAALAAAALLGVILLAGRRFRGAVFLPGYVNPAEMVKVLLLVFAADWLARHRDEFSRTLAGLPAPSGVALGGLALGWGGPLVLLLAQRDLGMVILLSVVLLLLLVVATRRPGWLVLGGVAAAAAAAAAFAWTTHGRGRIAVWLNPFRDETGTGWQLLQGLSALYAGGLFGTGLGAGHPHAIPIASTDFMYAVFGEEAGYAGCGLLLLVYLAFLGAGWRAARRSRDEFSRLLAAGIVLLLAVQTLWNVGGVVKALPLTGIPLPFLSQGGSSLVTCFTMAGLLWAASDTATAGIPRRSAPRPRRSGKPRAPAP